MRAVVYQGNQQFAIKDLGDPASPHGQVVVDVEFCAICGTDAHAVMYDIARVGSVLATFNAPAPGPDTHHRVSLSSLPHPQALRTIPLPQAIPSLMRSYAEDLHQLPPYLQRY